MTTGTDEGPTRIDLMALIGQNAKNARAASVLCLAVQAKFEKAAEMRINQTAIINQLMGKIERLESELNGAHTMHRVAIRELEAKVERMLEQLAVRVYDGGAKDGE